MSPEAVECARGPSVENVIMPCVYVVLLMESLSESVILGEVGTCGTLTNLLVLIENVVF